MQPRCLAQEYQRSFAYKLYVPKTGLSLLTLYSKLPFSQEVLFGGGGGGVLRWVGPNEP